MDRKISDLFVVPRILISVIAGMLFIGCGGGNGGGGGSAQTSSNPQDTLNTVIQAASKNDNVTISACFTSNAQEKYQHHFINLTKMREFGESMSKAEKIDLMDNLAVYKSTFVKDGVTLDYYIFLVKDEKGEWKLDTF